MWAAALSGKTDCVLLCPPTAPALPLEETGTSVRRRFSGSSRTSRCLLVVNMWGARRKAQEAVIAPLDECGRLE